MVHSIDDDDTLSTAGLTDEELDCASSVIGVSWSMTGRSAPPSDARSQ